MKTLDMKKNEFIKIENDINSLNSSYILESNHDRCFISFIYNGRLYYLQASAYYPFTDVNYPAPWVYMVYNITDINSKQQHTYFTPYNGVESLKNYNYSIRPLTKNQKINVLNNNYEKLVKSVIRRSGGDREKEIIKNGAFMSRGETWNSEHKVIEILEIMPQIDGYRNGFQVDVVTMSICG